MKINFLISILILSLFSSNLLSKTIYCFSDITEENLFTNLNYAELIIYFKIDDRKKNIDTLKYYNVLESPDNSYNKKYIFQYQNLEIENEFIFNTDQGHLSFESKKNKEIVLFNENEIIWRENFINENNEVSYIAISELDRVTGILVTAVMNKEDNSYSNIYEYKLMCENHKGI